jgi:hypothetical protein
VSDLEVVFVIVSFIKTFDTLIIVSTLWIIIDLSLLVEELVSAAAVRLARDVDGWDGRMVPGSSCFFPLTR